MADRPGGHICFHRVSSSNQEGRMRWVADRMMRIVVVAVAVVLVDTLLVLAHQERHVAAQQSARLEATIFSYDGHDFVRTKTTLKTPEGKPAVNTKLEHDNPAFTPLTQKHSYEGEITVFGHKYDAKYAPLTGADGKLTGALFVAVAR
jgi:hypothetical protein